MVKTKQKITTRRLFIFVVIAVMAFTGGLQSYAAIKGTAAWDDAPNPQKTYTGNGTSYFRVTDAAGNVNDYTLTARWATQPTSANGFTTTANWLSGTKKINYTIKKDSGNGTGTITEKTTSITSSNAAQVSTVKGTDRGGDTSTYYIADFPVTLNIPAGQHYNGYRVDRVKNPNDKNIVFRTEYPSATSDNSNNASAAIAGPMTGTKTLYAVQNVAGVQLISSGGGKARGFGQEYVLAWNTYSVKYNANGGSGSMANGNSSAATWTYSSNYTLRPNAFTRAGYTFTGWNTKADGSGDSYTDGQRVSNLSTAHNTTVTLYAQWDKNETYSVVENTPAEGIEISNFTAGSDGTYHYSTQLADSQWFKVFGVRAGVKYVVTEQGTYGYKAKYQKVVEDSN